MKTAPNYFLLSFIIFSVFACSVQDQPDKGDKASETFIKYFNDLGDSRGVTVEELPDGGFILTGYTTDGNFEKEDLLLIKTNSSGEVIWKKTFGGNEEDYGWAVRQIPDGGFIIVGYTSSFGEGGLDVYVIKTDSLGNEVWSKTYGGEKDEFGWDIRVCKDNGFIIAAQTESTGNGEVDAYLIKLNSEGIPEWTNTYGGSKTDRIFSVQETEDNGFISTGITYSYSSVSPDDRDGYLLKTDSLGKEEWYKTFGEDYYDVGHSIALTNDDGFLITGYGESFASPGNRDVYLIKTDLEGNNQWRKVHGGSGEERGIKGYQTKDGGFVVIGFSAKNRDVYLIKTDNQGDTIWTRTFGNKEEMDFGYTVRETKDGGFILTGHSEDAENRQSRILLIKTNQEGLVD